MHRRSVEPDGAGAAIAGVAALFDAEATVLAQKSTQALARFQPVLERAVVDAEGERAGSLDPPGCDVIHPLVSGRANSARI
jgi:hypothetical protein